MPYKRAGTPYWWVSFTDASGKRVVRSTKTTDRKEADALEHKWKLEAYREKFWEEQPSRSFDELMLAYLKETQNEKRSAERDRYSAKHLQQFFTGMQLNKLKRSNVRAYINKRKADGVQAGTINRELGLFSSALNYARVEWDWDIANPVMGMRLSEPQGRVRYLRRKEVDALIQSAGHEPRADHLPDFIRLAVNTGMRRGEMLGLEWRRVDLKASLVYLDAEHTKAGKRRSVPLNQEARLAIRNRLEFKMRYCPQSPWVFADKQGRRIASLKHSFASACKRVGIENFRPHDLRHTCAAWLVSAAVPLPEVRDVLGHSTIRMTERYAHLAPENIRAAVAKLDGLLHSDYSGEGGVATGCATL